VIKVTLEFNTQEDLLAFFTLRVTPPERMFKDNQTPAAVAKVEAPKPEKPAKVEKPAATPPAAKSTPAPVTAAAEPAPEVKPTIDYPTLQKAVFALANASREAAGAVAKSLGVKTFKELDASRWGEALAAVNAKLAELADLGDA